MLPRILIRRLSSSAADAWDVAQRRQEIGCREYLFNLAEDQRERANLKDRHPELFAELKAAFAVWDTTMLPYPADSSSDGIEAKLSDRY